MRYGVALFVGSEGTAVPPGFAGPKEIVEIAQTAETLGYDAVWVRDHLTTTGGLRNRYPGPRPNIYDVLIALAYCAAVTERIKLGLGVVVLPFRDPILLAKQVSTLDVFSGGRVLFGIGLGGSREEFEMLYPRLSRAHRGNMVDEALEVIRLLFTEPVASFKGDYYEFNDVVMDPKPLQNPFPIIVSGYVQKSIERAARFGAGLMLYPSPPRAMGERIDQLRALVAENGRDFSMMELLTHVSLCIATTHEEAIRRVRLNPASVGLAPDGDLDDLMKRNLVGTPAEIIERVGEYRAAGLTHFMINRISGDSLEEKLEQIRVFAEEVLPATRADGP